MENRIKECQLDLYADRTSCQTMRANQLRLWFASMAYVLICALRRIGLTHTQFARASCGTIRLKLLKIGALVCTSVRRIKLAMPSAFAYQAEYRAAHAALAAARWHEPESAANSSRLCHGNEGGTHREPKLAKHHAAVTALFHCRSMPCTCSRWSTTAIGSDPIL